MRSNERLEYISDSGSILFAPDKKRTPFWWGDAEGLSGMDNDISTTKGSGQDGEHLTAMSLGMRVVTIEGCITVNADENRRKMLSLCNPKHKGRLVYRQGELTRYIPCILKKAPQVGRGVLPKFQLEFLCPNPFWRAGSGDTSSLATIAQWLGDLAFEVEIASEGMDLEHRTQSLLVNVINGGDVPAGMKIVFTATGATSNPSLVNVQTQETLLLTITMQAGDIITVTTGYGEKRATLNRGGVESNVFNTLSGSWLQLEVGDNVLRYNSTVVDNLEVEIYYDNCYLGV